MTKFTHLSGLSLAALTITGLVAARPATAYTFTTIDAPGSVNTYVSGINSDGTIVGYYTDSSSNNHSFLKTSGIAGYTTFSFPGASGTTFVSGINDSGKVAGSYSDSSVFHGFLGAPGSLNSIDVPGRSRTIVEGVNNVGQVVGRYTVDASNSHGFFGTSNGGFTSFDVTGASFTFVQGINDTGQIVGYYTDASSIVHGYYRAAGTGVITAIGFVGATTTEAYGINAAGEIVGFYDDVNGRHGFLDAAGSFTTVDVAGATSTIARGINASGQITGIYNDAAGTHGFIATPDASAAPEPSQMTGLAFGGLLLACLLIYARNRNTILLNTA